MKQTTSQTDIIYVDQADLPVYCPGPHTPLWSLHPRVYIEISTNGNAHCPYCGTTYQLRNQPE